MNMIPSFQQVTWRDVTWCEVMWRENHKKKRPEWTTLDAMGLQNNNHPQEWEDNIACNTKVVVICKLVENKILII